MHEPAPKCFGLTLAGTPLMRPLPAMEITSLWHYLTAMLRSSKYLGPLGREQSWRTEFAGKS